VGSFCGSLVFEKKVWFLLLQYDVGIMCMYVCMYVFMYLCEYVSMYVCLREACTDFFGGLVFEK
jgi:hypothetical protein